MSRKMVILSNTYPDSIFINNELKYIDGFDELYVFQKKINEYKEINKFQDLSKFKKIRYFLTDYNLERKNFLLKYMYRFKQIFSLLFWKELFTNYKKILNKNFISNILILTSNLYNLREYSKYIEAKLKKLGLDNKDSEILFYAYRMHIHIYVFEILKKKYPNAKFIARGHGYDLFEYRWKNSYIPLQKNILNEIDLCIAISNQGKKYIEDIYEVESRKVFLNYMGKDDLGLGKYVKSNKLRLVSCSRIDPIKRLDRIISTLSKVTIPVEWTHIGGGDGLEDIKQASKHINNPKVEINLLGFKKNNEVLDIYINNSFDLFINVSEEEGLPVSIMEASSFGIPSVATDVGGTSEIVNNKTGFLIPKDFEDSYLIETLERFYNFDEETKLHYRKQSREMFLNKFYIKTNVEDLSKQINKLFERD